MRHVRGAAPCIGARDVSKLVGFSSSQKSKVMGDEASYTQRVQRPCRAAARLAASVLGWVGDTHGRKTEDRLPRAHCTEPLSPQSISIAYTSFDR